MPNKTTYTIPVEAGQDIYDIAIQEYGNPQAVFILMEDNPVQIPNLDADLSEGMTLTIREAAYLKLEANQEEMIDKDIMLYFRKKELTVNNASIEDV